jgi:hypothetical protein
MKSADVLSYPWPFLSKQKEKPTANDLGNTIMIKNGRFYILKLQLSDLFFLP